MRKITKDDLMGAWKAMGDRFACTFYRKQDAPEMMLLGRALEAAGIMPYAAFMRLYSTTLGDRIYLTFVPGEEGISYWSQLMICVHEVTHVQQGRKEGFVSYGKRYLSTPGFRGAAETEAWIYGNVLLRLAGAKPWAFTSRVATMLRAYAVSPDVVAAAQRQAAIADRALQDPDWRTALARRRLPTAQPLLTAARYLQLL